MNPTQYDKSKFNIPEVVELINSTVISIKPGTPHIPQNLGIVVGVLTLNEEVEMVVKFIDRISQFTKAEFVRSYSVIDEEIGT